MAGNRTAWEIASRKYVEEADDFLRLADGGTLLPHEVDVLTPLVAPGAVVVHVQSGNGTDDVGLARLGAGLVVGVDFSVTAAVAAQRRAAALGERVAYTVGDALAVPLRSAVADVVYTGKGALPWLADLAPWAAEVARVLRPGGHLFLHEAHPAAALWDRDQQQAGLVPGRSYFGGTRVNDTFPASAIERFSPSAAVSAIEWQWTLADVVGSVLEAGLVLGHLAEHPEPFWRPGGAGAAAWAGHLPNSFTLAAQKQGPA